MLWICPGGDGGGGCFPLDVPGLPPQSGKHLVASTVAIFFLLLLFFLYYLPVDKSRYEEEAFSCYLLLVVP